MDGGEGVGEGTPPPAPCLHATGPRRGWSRYRHLDTKDQTRSHMSGIPRTRLSRLDCMPIPSVPQKQNARPEHRARRQTGTRQVATALSRRLFGIGSITAPLHWPGQASGSIAPDEAPRTAGGVAVNPTATIPTPTTDAPTTEFIALPFTYFPANSDGNTAPLRVRLCPGEHNSVRAAPHAHKWCHLLRPTHAPARRLLSCLRLAHRFRLPSQFTMVEAAAAAGESPSPQAVRHRAPCAHGALQAFTPPQVQTAVRFYIQGALGTSEVWRAPMPVGHAVFPRAGAAAGLGGSGSTAAAAPVLLFSCGFLTQPTAYATLISELVHEGAVFPATGTMISGTQEARSPTRC